MPQFVGSGRFLKPMKTKEKIALNERRPRPDRRYPARSHHLIGKILPIQIAGMWGGMGGNLTHQVTGSSDPLLQFDNDASGKMPLLGGTARRRNVSAYATPKTYATS